ncbi:2-C-methyl-D-erythritol 2,4-cyclodiphosphate synthase [Syntrophomonas zehnderi OL-4]|uniref:2-C-methyl-D-erythritol 2,4-cyclodiphosphate synthase n=1 Tax=Syntrophomonas zehnderi OL-4 TaxID=690567 RepID=A0A0E4GC44_9FIRM|nr:2-C-methyl-D-erythritol 2,4-cyclodiphosphate synthase [Syntrophomonas zehnderi]CFX03821.1 2-C-methyl-D-erythritol 2,4-cyclodiphosphate synthase [Syntrophomonas zehnderi OL-4]
MRIGIGYDVHRLTEGRQLILGGVEIASEKGLLGHSDADVLLHAICDALLGAAALGDIGRHFPDTSQEFKDINSLVLMERTGQLIKEQGHTVVNIDSTIIAQRPKLAPYIDEMVINIARVLNISPGQVNIKATTTEGLGWEGSEAGIAAQAVVLLKNG